MNAQPKEQCVPRIHSEQAERRLEEIGSTLIDYLHAQGIPMDRLNANAATIGIMLGALNMIERIGAGLE